MIIVFIISAIILIIAMGLTCYRIIIGPNSLDRLIGVDMLVATIISGLCLWCSSHRQYYLAPTIVTLALVAFIGSVAIARYRISDSEKN